MGWADHVCEKLAVPPGLKGSTSLVWSLMPSWEGSGINTGASPVWYVHQWLREKDRMHPQQVFSCSPRQTGEISWHTGGHSCHSEWPWQAAGTGQQEPCDSQQRPVQSPARGIDYPHTTPKPVVAGSSPAQKAILVDKRSSSWEFNTYRGALSIYPAGMCSLCSNWWGHIGYPLSSFGSSSNGLEQVERRLLRW